MMKHKANLGDIFYGVVLNPQDRHDTLIILGKVEYIKLSRRTWYYNIAGYWISEKNLYSRFDLALEARNEDSI